MFLDGLPFGFEAVSHERNEVFDNSPITASPESP